MVSWLRRLFWLAVLGGGAYGGWAWWQRSRSVAEPPEWPPLDTASGETSTDAGTDTAAVAAAVPSAGGPDGADDEAPRWVEPVDGDCPDGYHVKANDNSGIYHVPGGRFYDRTAPERCYATTADAEADGYRAAKA